MYCIFLDCSAAGFVLLYTTIVEAIFPKISLEWTSNRGLYGYRIWTSLEEKMLFTSS